MNDYLLKRMIVEAHQALDDYGIPKTKAVRRRVFLNGAQEVQEITLSVAERIRIMGDLVGRVKLRSE
jgi:hypothetical protein